jgi:hypothetical protein
MGLGIQSEARFTIEQPAAAQVNSQTSCASGVCSILLTAAGGTGSYSFLWEDGTKGAIRNNISPGVYCVSAYDARQCRTKTCVEVKEQELVGIPEKAVGP